MSASERSAFIYRVPSDIDPRSRYQALLREREKAVLAVQEHHTEFVTWLRRLRNSRRRLREINDLMARLP
ncbi:MAG TPA: hypothetical protein VII92_12645 [Anaerolineae bacterium]